MKSRTTSFRDGKSIKLGLFLTLLAYLAPGAIAGQAPPPHESAWVETKEPDIRTVFLWKFSSAADGLPFPSDPPQTRGIISY